MTTGAGRSRDGVIRVVGKHERLGGSVDREDRASTLEVDGVRLLIGRKERAVDEHTAVDEVQPPVPSADEDSGHDGSACGSVFDQARSDLRRDRVNHLPECPQKPTPHARRRKPSRTDAAAHLALLGVLRRSWHACSHALRSPAAGRAAHLLVSLGHVRVIQILLLLLKRLRRGKLLRARLRARRK